MSTSQIGLTMGSGGTLARAADADRLTAVEKIAAAVCVVSPFRIFLNEFLHVDLHLGVISFAILSIAGAITVRDRPAGFPTGLDVAMLGFAAISIADFTLLTGPTPLATKGLVVEGRFVFFYFVARVLGLRGQFAGWLCAAMAVIGIAEAVVGALEYHLAWGTLLRLCDRTWTPSFWKMGLPRLYSFAMDPLGVGYLFVFALAGCAYLASAQRLRLVAVIGLFAIWQALPLTLSRAPLALALLMTAALPFFDRRRGLWFVEVSLCAIVAAGLVFVLRGWNQPLSEYAEVGGTLADTSAVVHGSALRSGLGGIWEQPLGYGFGEAGLVAIVGGGTFPTNETYYVTLGLQMGIPGVACFLAIVAATGMMWLSHLRSTSRERRALGYAGGAIWFTLLAGGLFSGSWTILVPQFFFWLLTGAAANQQATAGMDAS